jgi:O-antigen ligase
MIRRETPHPIFSYAIYFGCLLSICTVSFDWGSGRNILFITSYIAFIALIFNFKYYTRQKYLLLTPLSFVVLGLANLLWVEVYKKPDEYIDLYRAYFVTGKILIATGFILVIALNEQLKVKKWLLPALIALGIAVNGYALYQSIHAQILRIELNFDRATVAAYIITAVNILMLYSLLQIKNKFNAVFFSLGFLISFVSIIHTETRAAILVFPVVSVLMFTFSRNVTAKQKYIYGIAVVVLIALSAYFLKDVIEKRIEAFRADMAQLSSMQENSVGARIAMMKAGMATGNQHLLGQSAEQRGKEITALALQRPELTDAVPYITIHLHNEIIDNYSLRGVWGVILLLVLHISLLVLALKWQKNAALLAITLAMITYGWSDVLFFSSEAAAIFGLATILSVLIGNTAIKKQAQAQESEKNVVV